MSITIWSFPFSKACLVALSRFIQIFARRLFGLLLSVLLFYSSQVAQSLNMHEDITTMFICMHVLQVQAWQWAMAMPPGSMHCMTGRKSAIGISPLGSKQHPEVVETAIILAAKRFTALSMTDMTATILAMVAMTRSMVVHILHLLADGGGSFLLVLLSDANQHQCCRTLWVSTFVRKGLSHISALAGVIHCLRSYIMKMCMSG